MLYSCNWFQLPNYFFSTLLINFHDELEQIKVWDAQAKQCVRVLAGHTGSVKSICPHPSNHGRFEVICFLSGAVGFLYTLAKDMICHHFDVLLISFWFDIDIIVSGSRDGTFALWDLRCSDSSSENLFIP